MISTGELDVLVDAAWIADHLGHAGVRLVEVDVSPKNYNEGHVPGAVLWNAYSDLRNAEYHPVPRADFQGVVSRSGISPDTTIVFYGYGSLLGFWLMKAHGHQDARMLNGNREEWERHGGEWSTEIPPVTATSYRLPPEDGAVLASRADVETAIGDPGVTILDVRADAEYRGEIFWPSGATEDVGRAGHVPTAVSVPIDLVRNGAGDIKGVDELRRLYAGVSPDQRVIAYCTIGNRAALAWFILTHLLGYPDVAVYQGSYVEWGKLADSPIETG